MVGKRGINGFIAREESFSSRSRKVESVDWFCYAITEEDIAPWSVVVQYSHMNAIHVIQVLLLQERG